MASESRPGTSDNRKFLTAEDLLNLRNPLEELKQFAAGPKFSDYSDDFSKKVAVETALEYYEKKLSIKNGAKIADLMQGEWREDLKATVVTNIKGKFIHHMGYSIDDKICLSPEESLFLLENGSLEILNGGMPMSKEEAYATMLKGHLSLEKYLVYFYLTHSGFIVVPHERNLNSKVSEGDSTKGQNKEIVTPSEEPKDKNKTFTGALNFTGAFSRESNIDEVADVPNIHSIDQNKIIDVVGDDDLDVTQSTNTVEGSEHVQQNEIPVDSESACENVESFPCDTLETAMRNVTEQNEIIDVENESDVSQSANTVECSEEIQQNVISVDSEPAFEDAESSAAEALKKSMSNNGPNNVPDLNTSKFSEPEQDIEDMDVDSQSTDVSCGMSENSREAFETGIIDEASTGTTPLPSHDSQSSLFHNKQQSGAGDNSLVLSCSSESQIIEEATQNDFPKNEIIDDEVTLLEVTKKESTVTAVIDLLSDDSSSDNKSNSDEDEDAEETTVSDSEMPVERKSNLTDDKKNVLEALNLKTRKSKKIPDCKIEAKAQNSQAVEPAVQYPDLNRKEVVCVPRPPSMFLPNTVRPAKEVYVLNLHRHHVSLPGTETSTHAPRMWNSFRDLQEYQRARRRSKSADRNSSRYHGRDNPYRFNRFSKHSDDRSPRLDSGYRNYTPDSCRNDHFSSQRHSYTHYDRISPRPYEEDYHNNSYRDRQNNRTHYSVLNDEEDVDHRNRLPCDERKPLKPSNSPTMNGSANDTRNFPWEDGVLQPPELPHSAPFSSMIHVRHGEMAINYSNTPANPLNLSRYSSPISNIPFVGPNDFANEVQRTAYSYATTMVSSILGPNINLNNSHASPFQPNWNNNHLRLPFSNNFPSNPNAGTPILGNDNFPGQNNFYRNNPYRRRIHRGNPFPCLYRNVSNKRSWTDLKTGAPDSVQSSFQSSRNSFNHSNKNSDSSNKNSFARSSKRSRRSAESDNSDVEEIPINKNEFLWNSTSVCPLVIAGIQTPSNYVLNLLQALKSPEIIEENNNIDEPSPAPVVLKISFDVYLPNSKFKKSSPGTPKYRIIVRSFLDRIIELPDIEPLLNKFDDGSILELALVDGKNITFTSLQEYQLSTNTSFEDV